MSDGWSRRNVLGALAAVGGAGLLKASPALAQDDGGLLARLRSAGVAKVAIAAQPPYSEMLPDGTLTGLGPSVAKLAMERLGVPKLEGIVVPYSEIIPGLMAGRWDFVAACLSVTKARCDQVLFSAPICFDPVVAAYPEDMKDPPASMAEAGKRGLSVGIITGGYFLPMMRTLTTPDKIQVFPDTAALMDGMFAKRFDVAIGANSGFVAFKQQRATPFMISPPMTDFKPAGSGPAFRPTDTDLFDAFNKEVMAMKASGEIAKFDEQFGFTYFRDQYDTVTMTEACERAI